MYKIVILCGDNNYKRQILTTIKSVCFHNDNVKFYIINHDIDSKWIESINLYLNKINCSLIDIKIDDSIVKDFDVYKHSSIATFFRYFIPLNIKDKKVLYLDTDLVVNGNLDEIFNIDITNYPLAAVKDMICFERDKNTMDFNAGVLLINNDILKKEDIFNKAISIHLNFKHELKDYDQSVPNILFKDRWLSLDVKYNIQVGLEYIKKIDNKKVQKSLPLILPPVNRSLYNIK